MPERYAPSVFVSSTCYDLKQVRADLKEFLDNMGFDSVLSEYDCFPVDPNADTVDNCLEAVRSRCDLFVLIIGGRYGSINDSGKSITNLEYLTAKAEGVPIYVFVLKSVLDVLPVWKANPSADFSTCVDSSKVFEFVDQVRQPSEHWVFPFDTSQNIILTLRKQLSYLFSESLQLRKKLKGSGLEDELAYLTGPAALLALSRPVLWDAKLFSQLMSERIKQASKLKNSLEYGITTGTAWHFEGQEQTFTWINERMVQFVCMRDSAIKVVNVALNDVMKKKEVRDKVSLVRYAANTLGDIYSDVIQWLLDLHRVKTTKEFETSLSRMDLHGRELHSAIESFCTEFAKLVEKAASESGNQQIKDFRIDLTLALSEPTELLNAINTVGSRGKRQED